MKRYSFMAAAVLFAAAIVVGAGTKSSVAGGLAVVDDGWAGKMLVRLQGTYVATQEDIQSVRINGGAPIPGADADVSDQFIPTLTISYFLSNNLAVELFCCFSRHDIDGAGTLNGFGDLADTWIFPPVVTLQYHFTGMGGIKPYVGAGVNYTVFFNESTGSGALAGMKTDIDDAFGLALQAGVDVDLGNDWYFNVDVKKIWLNTDVTWSAPGTRIVADADLDPLTVSVGIGYRFNLSDLIGG